MFFGSPQLLCIMFISVCEWICGSFSLCSSETVISMQTYDVIYCRRSHTAFHSCVKMIKLLFHIRAMMEPYKIRIQTVSFTSTIHTFIILDSRTILSVSLQKSTKFFSSFSLSSWCSFTFGFIEEFVINFSFIFTQMHEYGVECTERQKNIEFIRNNSVIRTYTLWSIAATISFRWMLLVSSVRLNQMVRFRNQEKKKMCKNEVTQG